MNEIKHSIKALGHKPAIVMIKGVVVSVDKDRDTCDIKPIDGTAEFFGVKLEATDKTDDVKSDVVRYPEIDSFAVMGLIDNNPADTFLIKATKYESVVFLVAKQVKITASGNGNVTVDAQKITINRGINKGLVNLVPLVQKINGLEKTVNSLLATFKSHTHLGVTTGTGTSGITSATTPDSISPLTKSSELEDANILH